MKNNEETKNNIKRPMSGISHSKLSLQQSPKISSKKFRNIIIDSPNNLNKLFSLRDINIHKIQKGTELPIQYMRNKSEFEDNYFSTKFKTINSESRNINHNIKQNKTEIEIENKNNKRPQSAKNLKTKNRIKKNKEEKKIPELDLENLEKKKKSNNDVFTLHNLSDRYLPKNYKYYFQCVTNPNFFKNKINNKIKEKRNNRGSVNLQNIKLNNLKSDIFMLKETKDPKEINYNIFRENHKKNIIYLQSDIFNTNKNLTDFEKEKTGEKFLFNSQLSKNKFSNIAESKSNWEDKKINIIKAINKSSVSYNILNSSKKNYINQTNKDVKTYNKTKGIDEFVDLTRITSSNPNLDFQNKFKENPFTFRRIRQLCSDFIESYNQGKAILKKPFPKEKENK